MSNIVKKIMNAGVEYDVPAGIANTYTAWAGIDITNNVISADMTTAVYDNTTSGATATNVQDAIDEVFQSVSNGKTLIAAAITDKWVSTAASDSFSTMASNIESLEIATEDMIISYNILSNSNRALIWTATATQPFDRINTMPILYTNDFSAYMVGFYTSWSSSEYYNSGKRLYKINKDWTYTYDTNISISRTVRSGSWYEDYYKYGWTNSSFIWYKDPNNEDVIFCCKKRQTTTDSTRPTRYKLVKLLKYNLTTGVFTSWGDEDATEEYAYWDDLTNPPERYSSSSTSIIIPQVTVNAVWSDSLNMFLSI